MSNSKKLLQAAAGAAGGEALNVEDVFSTYLYEGTGSAQTITNGIDLDGEGGMVWLKRRSASESHYLYDTERGTRKAIASDNTAAQSTLSLGLDIFNSDGFRLNVSHTDSGVDFTTWTFRKAPKFFDVVTYTGDGTSNRAISHNLNSSVGTIIVKSTSNVTNWMVWHKDLTTNYLLTLNSTAAQGDYSTVTIHDVTSTSFQVDNYSMLNASGVTYVAYLFAHNDGDGEFGPDGDADIIKCGSYTGNGSSTGPSIDLGFEPQWLLIKNASGTGVWWMLDVMRGLVVGGDDAILTAQGSGAEYAQNVVSPTPTGFNITSSAGQINTSGDTYIYIAIRRGPMAVPESATDVFAIDTANSTGNAPPWMYSGWPVDLGMHTNKTGYATNARVVPRLTSPNYLYTSSTSAEISADTTNKFDYMDGYNSGTFTSTDFISWMWRRAPSFFDVVAYTGNGTAGRTVSHNLGVAPEMIWVKNRADSDNWEVYHSALTATSSLRLNTTNDEIVASTRWNNTEPTDTVFTVGTWNTTNGSGDGMIAYLFASLDGVSKVGSYTGNGSTQTIDCGFSSGARFVLIKRTDSAGNWYVWDTERGIVSGNDSHLLLNTTAAEVTTYDSIDPVASGFAVNQVGVLNNNESGASYIFYAIA